MILIEYFIFIETGNLLPILIVPLSMKNFLEMKVIIPFFEKTYKFQKPIYSILCTVFDIKSLSFFD